MYVESKKRSNLEKKGEIRKFQTEKEIWWNKKNFTRTVNKNNDGIALFP